MHTSVAHDRHGVTTRTERGGEGERQGYRGACLAADVKATGVREVHSYDRLVHAREHVPEAQLLSTNHVDRRLYACRRRDAGVVRLGLERRARQDEGGNDQGQLRDAAPSDSSEAWCRAFTQLECHSAPPRLANQVM